MIEMLQAKIHNAVISDADLNYEGSISISKDLLALAGIKQYQKVTVADKNNGNRFETYVIATDKPNYICVNGAAARLVLKGDSVIIMSYCLVNQIDDNYSPKIIRLNNKNEPIKE